MANHELPLAGVRVLELADHRTALGARLLADLGADVLLIEPPAGADIRAMAPFLNDQPGPERSFQHLYFNANKRSLIVDIETPAGADELRRIAAGADILIESRQPGELARLGPRRGRAACAQPAPDHHLRHAVRPTRPQASVARHRPHRIRSRRLPADQRRARGPADARAGSRRAHHDRPAHRERGDDRAARSRPGPLAARRAHRHLDAGGDLAGARADLEPQHLAAAARDPLPPGAEPGAPVPRRKMAGLQHLAAVAAALPGDARPGRDRARL